MLPIIISICLIIVQGKVHNQYDENVEIITDNNYENINRALIQFLAHENKPTSIHLMLQCWPTRDVHTLMKRLSKYGYHSGKFHEQVVNIKKHQDLFVLDLDCPYANAILKSANNQHLFNYPQRWFIFSGKTIQLENSSSFPPNLTLSLNSRLYYFRPSDHSKVPDQFVLESIYNIVNTSTYIHDLIGHFDFFRNLTFIKSLIDYTQRRNQHGFQLHIPFVWTHKESTKNLDDFRGNKFDPSNKHKRFMMHHLMEIMNSTYRGTSFSKWGSLQRKHYFVNANNETVFELRYDGMVGFLQEGTDDPTIHIGGTVCYQTADRIQFLDFQSPAQTHVFFTFRAPSLSVVNNLLTMPFTNTLWLTCFGFLFIFYVVLAMIIRWEQRNLHLYDLNNVQNTTLLRDRALDVVQMEIGAVCQQGAEAQPWSVAGKTATLSLFLCFLFVYTAYSANIVSLLQSTSDSIKTLEDLLYSKISLGVENAAWMKFFFKNQNDPLRKTIYEQKIVPANKSENFFPVDVGMEMMRTQFFAFHSEESVINSVIANTYLEREKCGIKKIRYFSKVLPYMPLKKNSIFKELVRPGFCRLMEHGLDSRYYRAIYSENPKCMNQGGIFRSVSLDDCYFALLSYVIGLTFTLAIFILEHLTNKVKAYKKIDNTGILE